MLQLTVFGFVTVHSLPSAAELRVCGPLLIEEGANRPIAVFQNEMWGDGVEEFTRIDVEGPLEVWCIDGAIQLQLGAFPSISFEGGMMQSTNTLGRLLNDHWEILVSHTHWPELRICEAGCAVLPD